MKQYLLSLLLLVAMHAGARGFLENKGQWPSEINFRTEMPGGDVLATDAGLVYRLLPKGPEHGHAAGTGSRRPAPKPSPDGHVVGLQFLNANKLVFTAEYEQKARFHFFMGDEVSAADVKSYAALNAKEVYPGIDLKLMDAADGVKYEFHLKPGVSHRQIRLQFTGQDSLLIKEGRLHIITPAGEIIEDKPYAYQQSAGGKIPVPCKFKIQNSRTVSFAFPDGFDASLPLVIDPQLIFSSYSGAGSDNWGFTATYDEEGCLYAGGIVFGSNFPTTPGAIRGPGGDTANLITDVAILKYAPDGRTLRYGVYFGGAGSDIPVSMIVNSKNELLVLGVTSSSNFPGRLNTFAGGSSIGEESVSGIFLGGGTDVFIAKLAANGGNMISYLVGGEDNDGYLDVMWPLYGDQFRGEIYIDTSDNIYIAGCTYSSDFALSIPLASASGAAGASKLDGYVVKFDAGLNPMWKFLTGGVNDETLTSLRVNAAGEVYVFGHANSSVPLIFNSPGYINSFHTGTDALVIKISAGGSSVLAGTYLRGNGGNQYGYLLDLDSEENVVVLGATSSSYPVSPGKYSNASRGIFVHKLSADLKTSLWSSVIGYDDNSVISSTGFISPSAFMVSKCNQIYFSGWGGLKNLEGRRVGSSTFGLPTTENAYRRTTDGSDFYLAVFSENMTGLEYGSFFGYNNSISSDHCDGGTARFDKKGVVYQSVCSCFDQSGFPTFPADVWSSVNGAVNTANTCNNAAFKYDLSQLRADFQVINDSCGTNRNVAVVNTSTGGATFDWNFGNGESSEERQPEGISYPENDMYEIRLIVNDPLTCIKSDTLVKRVPVAKRPEITRPADTSFCPAAPLVLSADSIKNGKATWEVYRSTGLSNAEGYTTTFTPESENGRYYVTLTLLDTVTGCGAIKTILVSPKNFGPEFTAALPGRCTNDRRIAIQGTAAGIDQIVWDFGDGTGSDQLMPTHVYEDFDTYIISYLAQGGGCTDSGSISVDLVKIDIPNITTPNGDGANDVFFIEGVPEKNKLDIFNRWGSVLHSFENYNNTWSPEQLPAGVYFYALTTPEDEVCKGWFQVLK